MRLLLHIGRGNALFGLLIAVMLSHSPHRANAADKQPDFDIQAVAGKPFGVAKVTMHVPAGVARFSRADGDFKLTEKSHRACYPAFDNWLEKMAGEEDDASSIRRFDFYFLFRGDAPLDVTFRAPSTFHAIVGPKTDEREHTKLAQEWLKAFQERPSLQAYSDAEVPALVDNYLAAMISRRMSLSLATRPEWGRDNELNQTLGLLTGAESVRAAMAKELLLRPSQRVEEADKPLPAGVAPPALELPEVAADVPVEPMALHVPHECFYVRFGSFENFRWARKTLDDWGGDLRNLAAVRGIDRRTTARLERQLILKETTLAKVFGPQVIADVAIVGHDPFVCEGSSLGLIFQAKNSAWLTVALQQQREEALKQRGVRKETVAIAGHEVSLFSSPDNRVRSFYAVDGDFHLVTNSQTLVRRFYEAGDGIDPLGRSHEFRHSRTLLPLKRDDAAFVYLSDEFFRTLVGPKYRVEMTRRMEAQTELELIELATLAAAVEEQPAESVEQLVAADLLPAGFGKRADGSHPERVGNEFVDSLRGARGTFLPIADVNIEHVTKSEADAYAGFTRQYQAEWTRVDPAMLGVQRRPGKEAGREQIVLDVHIAPFAKQHYSMQRAYLGPSTRKMIAPVGGDILSAQASLKFGAEFYLFAGLRDQESTYQIKNRKLETRRDEDPDKRVEAYLGALDSEKLVEGFLNWKPDADGFVKNPGQGEWGRRIGEFDIIADKRRVLEAVGPQLRTIEAERPAQFRLHIGDVTHARLAEVARVEAYLQADRASHGNTRFLHNLTQELQVLPEDAVPVAEKLLDGKLVCPLGGKYERHDVDTGFPNWVSTRWVEVRDGKKLDLPAGYLPPPLDWFRGLDLEFRLDEVNLDAHAELNVQRK